MLKIYWWVGWVAFVGGCGSWPPGILIMVHNVRLMMFSLKMVDYSTSSHCPPEIFYGQVGGSILKLSYFQSLFVGPLLHACLKVKDG